MPGLETFSLREILQEPPAETDWIVEELVTTGLHMLVGPPKAGNYAKKRIMLRNGLPPQVARSRQPRPFA